MPKLYYFDIFGRAESFRMLLWKYGVQFEDCRINKEQMEEMKTAGKLEYGQLPAFELDDGTMLTQSAAIQRYITLKWGNDNQDPLAAYERENLHCFFMEDFFAKYLMPLMRAADADKPAIMGTLMSEGMPKLYETLSRKIGDRKWIVGDAFSSSDITGAGFFFNMVENPVNPMSAMMAEGYKAAPANLHAWIANVRAEMKEYLDTRKPSAM